jgi:hypothetical protein
MPLEEGDVWNLEEDILASVVLPVFALWVLASEKHSVGIENLHTCRDSHEAAKETPATLEED